MALSYLFYKLLALYAITDNQTKVYDLHYLLLAIEMVIILLICQSFQKVDCDL
jgi:uncharacterized membrane protein